MKQLEPGFYVAGQISADDVPVLAAQGIRTIINNRPDGEVQGQPDGSLIRTAAAEAGITYHDIAITRLTGDAVDETRRVLEGAEAPILAFCASGTRSTYLWALARSGQGAEGEVLSEKAEAAGYDLTPIRRFLR